ncbi:MAG: hypothetical protein ACTSX6_04055 [Candidatus Heimdallarchaeaceae archaeon]
MPGIFEENRIISLLTKFDRNLALSYLQRIREFRDELEEIGLIDRLTLIKEPTLANPIGFRLEFSDPILVMLSHPLCRMHARILYPIEFEWERFYVTQLGMLPVFFVDLNTITLIKFWSEAASQLSPQALRTILGKEAACMELRPKSRKISYSTMNFLIAFGADLWKTKGDIDEIMRNYMKYSYWAVPEPGFSFSTHLLHTQASIRYVVKVAKTLCLIDKISSSTKLRIWNRTIKVHKIRMRMLTERNGSFFFLRKEAYLPDDVLRELFLMEEKDKISIKESFLNAFVLEIKQKERSFELLSVISDIGASYFELAQTLIAYILMKTYNISDNVAFVCGINQLKTSFKDLLTQIGKNVRLPPTLSERVESTFDIALQSLYPLFILENEKIYFLHPTVFNYLRNKLQFASISQIDGKEKLIKILLFLEKMDAKFRYIELYLDETLEMFRGESKRETLSKLFGILRKIKIAKLLQRFF